MAQNLFKRVKPQQSNQQLLDNMDELLKKNRGGFSSQAFDVDSSMKPYKISDVKVGVSSIGDTSKTNLPKSPFAPLEMPQIDWNVPKMEEFKGMSAGQQFLKQFNQQVNPTSNAQTQDQKSQVEQQTGLSYGIQSTEDGGVLFSDGVVRYPDGTVREYTGEQARPIATYKDGGTLYSDGSIKRQGTDQEFVTQENISYIDGGKDNLIKGIFGKEARITQEYGNYNPGMGYAGNIHRGTDIVSQNDYKLPVNAKVVQVYQDDGTQWGSTSGHQGYGNSVLLQLSNGEMLRFSHLAEPVQYRVGDVINAYSSFGRMGSTGNSTGDHTDLELYDPSGNVINPSQFSGFGADAEKFKQEATQALKQYYENDVKQMSVNPPQRLDMQKYTQPTQQQKFEQQANIAPEWRNTQVDQKPTMAGNIGKGIEKLNPTGNVDFGVSELLQGQPKQAGQVLGATIERANPTGNNIDLGITEALRGDVQGSKDVRQATGQNIQRKIQEGLGNAQTFITGFFDKMKNETIPQAGEGLKALATPTAYAQERPSMSNINEFESKIGSSPNSSLMSMQPAISQGKAMQSSYNEGQKDIRDPFFTSGAAKNYSPYIKENADQLYGGALNTNAFNKDFYARKTAEPDIKSVFGNTSMYTPAQKQFTDYRSSENNKALNQWKSNYADPMFYDQSEVNRLFQAMQNASYDKFLDAGSLQRPTKKMPSLSDYLRIGKSVAQWYAETGQQGALDAQGGPDAIVTAQRNASGTSGGNNQVSIPQGSTLSYPQGVTSTGFTQPNPNSLYVAGNYQPNNIQNAVSSGKLSPVYINEPPNYPKSSSGGGGSW